MSSEFGPTGVPEFWRSTPEEVDQYVVNRVRKGTRKCLGTSVEGRPIWAASYGPEGRLPGTSNFPAGWASRNISSFLGEPRENEPPILMIVAGTHGGEMEGVVGALNLMEVLETGKDLAGNRRTTLAALAEGVRITILPLHNPDGRARVKERTLIGKSPDEFRRLAQGEWLDGTAIGWLGSKMHQPLNVDEVRFLGGYPNADGWNLMHDVSLSGPRAAETKMQLRLVEQERPDCVVHVHSSQLPPFFIQAEALLPDNYRAIQDTMGSRLYDALERRRLRPRNLQGSAQRKPVFNLATANFATSGALPLTFEGPHGISTEPFTMEEILAIHLTMYEEVLKGMVELHINIRELLG